MMRRPTHKSLLIGILAAASLLIHATDSLAGACGDTKFARAIAAPATIKLVDSPTNRIAPPEGVPYIVLGTQSGGGSLESAEGRMLTEYESFARAMTKRLGHPAVSYRDFKQYRLIKNASCSTEGDVEIAIGRLIGDGRTGLAGEARAILVKLDGFEPAHDQRGFVASRGVAGGGTTARELAIILNNPIYFRATRWFRDGEELTAEQVRAEFEPYFPALAPER